jgi:CDP-paratose 2-epimerase
MNILITGGLGFIGVNTATRLYENGHTIYIIDNMSRKGTIQNYLFLTSKIKFVYFNIDIRDKHGLDKVFESNRFDCIFHLAGQVAVTSSVKDPVEDFNINCLGTFNILECCRKYCDKAAIIYSSTNKVYGEFECKIIESDKRYHTKDRLFVGINENQNIDFHSPYGCSKGCGDQYVRDYSRIYGLNTVVLRQSCIYGYNQFGIEDQGWVSWLSIAATFDKPITIYGTGKQIRDVLFIDDLTNLYNIIANNIDTYKGQIYNIGGGINNTLSLLELIDLLSSKLGKEISYNFEPWRPGDQKIYISDISKIVEDSQWNIEYDINRGLDVMLPWIFRNKELFISLGLI